MRVTARSNGCLPFASAWSGSSTAHSASRGRLLSGRTPASFRLPSRDSSLLVARTATETPPVVLNDSSTETFNWFKHWWPVQLIYNLDTDRPNRIQLLDEYYAVWKSKNGEWVAMKDMCPHRLAPLSEGRVEEDGTLMCSYHGWRFNETGKCVKIPQADDEKSHEAACNNPRSCAMTYPCKEFARVLWIWADPNSSAEAESTPLPIPDDHAAALERSAKAGLHPGYTRDVPYGFNILFENVADPSHFPFSHHGTFLGSRDDAKSLEMKAAEPLFPNSIASVKYASQGDDRTGHLEVATPNCVLYQYGGISKGEKGTRTFNFMTPITATKTRFMSLLVSAGSLHGTLSLPLLMRLMMKFPWIFHLSVLPILDGDNVFLHIQDRYVRELSDPWSPRACFMPTSADSMVVRIRQWLQTKGGGGPQLEKVEGETTRRELLDRYSSHVAFCKICQDGLRFLKRVGATCQVVGTASLIVAFALLARSLEGSLAYWKAAVSFLPFCICAFIQNYIKEKIIPQFYFVDYIHAEKN